MPIGKRFSRETWFLTWLCLLDLLLTLYLIQAGRAVEANPLLAVYVRAGVLSFILAKLTYTLLPLAVLEWLRRRRGKNIQRIQQFGITAYLLVYVLGCLSINF